MLAMVLAMFPANVSAESPEAFYEGFEVSNYETEVYEVEVYEVSEVAEISELLTSAIDGSPFWANFDPLTNRVSMYSMDGGLIGYRYVDNEEAFWELVAINNEMTAEHSPLLQRIMENRQTSYNISVETAVVETVETEETPVFMPTFNTGSVFMTVPQASSPRPALGLSVFVGGGFLQTSREHEQVTLATHAFPTAMRTIDVFITNAFGDDWGLAYDVPAWTSVTMPIAFRGEPYGARVSSWYGSFSNVELRFFARPDTAPPAPLPPPPPVVNVTISFNPMGGTVSPATLTRTAGQVIGPIPTPLRAGHNFEGWFTAETGGIAVTNNTIVPLENTTYFARWSVNPLLTPFSNANSTIQAGTGFTTGNPFTTPHFSSHTGLVDVRFFYLAANPPQSAAFNVQFQVLNNNGVWVDSPGERVFLTAFSGGVQLVTFSLDVGVDVTARLIFRTGSSNPIRILNGSVNWTNELSELYNTVSWVVW